MLRPAVRLELTPEQSKNPELLQRWLELMKPHNPTMVTSIPIRLQYFPDVIKLVGDLVLANQLLNCAGKGL